jgi:sialate O-acetylesterase
MMLLGRPLRAAARSKALALFVLGLLIPPPQAKAQGGQLPFDPQTLFRPPVSLEQPASSRVYQRGPDGTAHIPFVIKGLDAELGTVYATLTRPGQDEVTALRIEDGKLRGVPTGGPYTLNIAAHKGYVVDDVTVRPDYSLHAENVFVGDLWVLAGQSNMEGYGDLIDVAPPHPKVRLLGMDGKWSRAREPLHWLVDSPDPVHSGDPDTRVKRSAEQHRKRTKGAGLGLPFAAAMVEATHVPVGLIACAHGGTSMAQWDPAKKNEGGKSLYGSMLRQVEAAGGKVKGVLWYQGEAEVSNARTAEDYPKAFADFIAALRSDLGQPDLPFYFVQIGRFVREGDPANGKRWNLVQDAQRRLPERVANTVVVSVVDLELDDLIHIGTQGLKRAGRRLARVAQREVFGLAGATTPTFDRLSKGPGNTLIVRFKGVNVSPSGRPDNPALGLQPRLHNAGFSIRDEEGQELPLLYHATVGKAPDTVILKLTKPAPEKAFVWYGHGSNPYCNLTDALDMAVPAFGPIPIE